MNEPSKTMVSMNYFTFAIFIPSNSTLFFLALGNCIGEKSRYCRSYKDHQSHLCLPFKQLSGKNCIAEKSDYLQNKL